MDTDRKRIADCAPASHSHVFSVAVDTNEIDITTMHIGPTSNISDKYSGIVYCPLTGKLCVCHFDLRLMFVSIG